MTLLRCISAQATIIVAVGLLAFVIVGSSMRSHKSVRLEPSVVKLVEDPFEGERVSLHVQLRNDSNEDVVIQSAHSSCSCVGLVAPGGITLDGELVDPIEVRAGQSLPIRATLAFDAAGDRTQRMAVQAKSCSGRLYTCTTRFEIYVQGGLRSDPGSVVFRDTVPGESREVRVTICDGHREDSGVVVSRVVMSDPAILKSRLEQITGDYEGYWSSDDFHPRYYLHLIFTPNADASGEEYVTVIPEDPSIKSLAIPVIWSNCKPSYVLSPPTLALLNVTANERVSRTVSVTIKEKGSDSDLLVLDKPPFVDVAVFDDGPSRKLINLNVVVPDTDIPQTISVAFGSAHTGEFAFRLPIMMRTATED